MIEGPLQLIPRGGRLNARRHGCTLQIDTCPDTLKTSHTAITKSVLYVKYTYSNAGHLEANERAHAPCCDLSLYSQPRTESAGRYMTFSTWNNPNNSPSSSASSGIRNEKETLHISSEQAQHFAHRRIASMMSTRPTLPSLGK